MNLIEVNYYGDDGTDISESTYTYNEDGNLIYVVFQVDDWTGNYSGWRECKYDDRGNLIEEIYDPGNGGVGEVFYHYKWIYDDKGNQIRRLDYDEFGNFICQHENEFDIDGNLIRADGYEWEYDEFGHCISMSYGDYDGYVWEYDAMGNVTKRVEYSTYEGIREDSETEYEYEFDSIGNIIKQKTLVNGEFDSCYGYKYELDNNAIRTVRYNEDGSIAERYEAISDTKIYDSYILHDENGKNIPMNILIYYEEDGVYQYMGDILCFSNITPLSGKVQWNPGTIVDENVAMAIFDIEGLKNYRIRMIPQKTAEVIDVYNPYYNTIPTDIFNVIGETEEFYQLETGWYIEKNQPGITWLDS